MHFLPAELELSSRVDLPGALFGLRNRAVLREQFTLYS
jgi:hypothetical protein